MVNSNQSGAVHLANVSKNDSHSPAQREQPTARTQSNSDPAVESNDSGQAPDAADATDATKAQGSWIFAATFALQLGIYAYLFDLSSLFRFAAPVTERPILLVFTLFTLAFVLHLVSLFVCLRMTSTRRIGGFLFLAAISFRMILLVSEPIQEVDIYRYCWDGHVVSRGISPFRYSPATVLSVSESSEAMSPELQVLVEDRNRYPGLRRVLSRVHFGELTTIYPPVSQAVFGVVSWLTPTASSEAARILIMKTAIVGFDVLTLVLLSRLLALLGMHVGWSILYGWSPLVLKEFANSGHLDSIAVALTLASLVCVVRFLLRDQPTSRSAFGFCGLAAALLALAVGAKLYPVILVPLLSAVVLKSGGWKALFTSFACFVVVVSLVFLPMFKGMYGDSDDVSQVQSSVTAMPEGEMSGLPPPPSETASDETNPSETFGLDLSSEGSSEVDSFDVGDFEPIEVDAPPGDDFVGGVEAGGVVDFGEPNDDGLIEFLSRWEMNDLIFMFVEENLRAESAYRPEAWFVFVPLEWRKSFSVVLEERAGIPSHKVPFFVTRVVTSLAFLLIAIGIAGRQWASASSSHNEHRPRELLLSEAQGFLENCMLTVAWFWLLAPTQNPWYWTWVLPLIPFARNRIWFVVGGLAMIYYLRFHFSYQLDGVEVLSSGYRGTDFFDFVVVWVEFGPWLLLLLITWLWRRSSAKSLARP